MLKRTGMAAGGLLLVAVAILVPGSAWEEMLGRAPSSLGWGPSLFRLLLAWHGLLLLGWERIRRAADRHPPTLLRATHPVRVDSWAWPLVLAMCALGLGIRFVGLNQGLWFDEVLTLIDFARDPLREIVTSFPNQNQHMLFSILSHLSLVAFGESAAALRLPSVLFGVASIPALFVLGCGVVGQRKALFATAIVTFSYHHVWFSQNARGYMGLLLWTTLATLLWLRALEHGTASRWTAYAVALALGMWTHLTMVFTPLAHLALYALGLAAPRLPGLVARPTWRPLAAWTLSATLTLQVYAFALPEFFRSALGEVSEPSEWTSPLWVLRELVRGLSRGYLGTGVVVAGAVVVGVGVVELLRSRRQALLALLTPGFVTACVVIGSGHNLWPRFFFHSMGFALLLAVHGLFETSRWLAGRVVPEPRRERLAASLGTALAILALVAAAATVPSAVRYPKQDFVGARDWVESQAAPSDRVVAVGLAGRAYRDYFAPDWSVADNGAELRALDSGSGRLWLVYTLAIEVKAYHEGLWDEIEKSFEVVKVFGGTLSGGEITVCRRRVGPAASEARDDG